MTDRIIPFPRTPSRITAAIESAPMLVSPSDYKLWTASVLHEAQAALETGNLLRAKRMTAVALGAISNMMRERGEE